jgi:hypothetical protein
MHNFSIAKINQTFKKQRMIRTLTMSLIRCFAILALLNALFNGRGDVVKLAESAQPEPAPRQTNVFSEISPNPTLNSEGQVVFHTDLRNNGFAAGWGIYLADQAGIKTIARTGDQPPDLNGNFYTFNSTIALNSTSQVFQVKLQKTLGGAVDDTAIYKASPSGLQQIIRSSAPAPRGGIFRPLQNTLFRVNQSGQVLFVASLTTGETSLFLSSSGNLAELAKAGPQGPFILFQNINGQAAIYALLSTTNTTGFYLADAKSVTPLALGKQPSPDGNGELNLFITTTPCLNDKGEIAFAASLASTTAGVTDNAGLFKADVNSLTLLVRKGQFVPGGNGRFLDFGQGQVTINSNSIVAFLANLTGTSGATADNAAIYQATGTNLTQVVRKGQPAPDGNGAFGDLSVPAQNNRGQIAFTATLVGTAHGTTDNQGLFVTDHNRKLVQVARSGSLVGNEILNKPLFFTGPDQGGLTGLNDDGDLAFWAELGGNFAVLLWNESIINNITQVGNNVQIGLSLPSGTTNYIQSTANLSKPFTNVGSPIIARGTRLRTNIVVQTDVTSAPAPDMFYRLAK